MAVKSWEGTFGAPGSTRRQPWLLVADRSDRALLAILTLPARCGSNRRRWSYRACVATVSLGIDAKVKPGTTRELRLPLRHCFVPLHSCLVSIAESPEGAVATT